MYKNKTYYETSSLVLASSLISHGIPLDSISKAGENKSVFVFQRTLELDKILELFWQKSLKIEPNTFWEATRFIKSRLYGGEK